MTSTGIHLLRFTNVDRGRGCRSAGAAAAYDGIYVALAEAIEALIVTCDSPLAKAAGPTLGEGFRSFRLSPSPR